MYKTLNTKEMYYNGLDMKYDKISQLWLKNGSGRRKCKKGKKLQQENSE